ncbi:hypothetical protein GO986_17815 [Deinococcus sp. HMF7620]|uniref:Uncharacterized protein n=1 Tax=Deinococcus arboris TaxID=2682977 RepID=A0A7C9LQJ5_9DEIO|nr:hypothetical protein [Deinococcus arboris]MVN88596.1 hypothetical protein [Deinococcus arboris]
MKKMRQEEGALTANVRGPVSQLENPSAFDQLAYAEPDFVPSGTTALARVRRAHMSLLQMSRAEMEQAVQDLAESNVPPARGLELLLRVTLGDAQSVSQAQLRPTGHSPLELESTCHEAAAIGVAHAMLGDYEQAAAHLLVARTLAQALGLTNRVQNLTLEWARVSSLRGRPEPAAIESQLRQAMPAKRRAWGQRTLAEAYMAMGCYGDALQAMGTPDIDLPLDRALRNFLHGLNGLPPLVEYAPMLPYAQLAAALTRAHWSDYGFSLVNVDGEPTRAYATILESIALVRSGDLAQQAVRTLSRLTFTAADLSVYRLVVLFWAVAQGAQLHGGALAGRDIPLLEQLRSSVLRLGRPHDVLRLLRRLGPDQFTLLAFSPLGDEIVPVGLQGLGLITGQHIVLGGAEHKLPGRTGRVAVLQALELPYDDLKRSEAKRYKQILGELGQPCINAGWLLRAYTQLADASERLGHLNDAAAWNASYQRVFDMLSTDLQTAIRQSKSRKT